MKCVRNSLKKFYGRYSNLIRKYQSSVKDMMADSFLDQFNLVVQLVLSPFFNTDLVTWIVTFYQLMLLVMVVMHETDNAYSIWSTWLCYWLV